MEEIPAIISSASVNIERRRNQGECGAAMPTATADKTE
jgi:hypothetical protein